MAFDPATPMTEKLTVTRDDVTATLTFHGTASDSYEDAVAFVQNQVGGYISGVWNLPATYDRGSILLYCTQGEIDISDPNASGGDWDRVIVTLTFGKLEDSSAQDQEDPPFGLDPENIGDISFEISAQELIPKKNSTNYVAVDDPEEPGYIPGGDPPAEGDLTPLDHNSDDPVKIVPLIKAQIHLKTRPTLDPSVWIDYVGKVNDDDFRGFAYGKVLFMGVKTTRTVNSDGTDSWDHSYEFQILPEGSWNSVWHQNQMRWVPIYPLKYNYADFNEMWEA